MQNGTVLIGGAHLARHDLAAESTEIDFSALAESSRTVLDLFPRMAGVRIVRTWAGLEAFMPDQIPVIGPSSQTGDVFHAFGFSAHGFHLSPVVGRIMAELVVDGTQQLADRTLLHRTFRIDSDGRLRTQRGQRGCRDARPGRDCKYESEPTNRYKTTER